MSRSLFITLPVADLQRSIAFFSALGFAFDPAFANEHGACLLISEHSRVMLAVRPFFAGLAGRPVADAHATAQMLLALSCDSREAVDALVATAAAIPLVSAPSTAQPGTRVSSFANLACRAPNTVGISIPIGYSGKCASTWLANE